MKETSRREILKYGAALPLAMHSLDLHAVTKPKPVAPPRRIMFICNSLGFYKPNFFPSKRGDLSQFEVSQGNGKKGENDRL